MHGMVYLTPSYLVRTRHDVSDMVRIYPIPPKPNLSHSNPSSPVLPQHILHPTLPHPSCPIPSRPPLSHLISSHLVSSHRVSIASHVVLSHPIRFSLVPSFPLQLSFHLNPSHPIPSFPASSCPIPSYPPLPVLIPLHPIPPHSIPCYPTSPHLHATTHLPLLTLNVRYPIPSLHAQTTSHPGPVPSHPVSPRSDPTCAPFLDSHLTTSQPTHPDAILTPLALIYPSHPIVYGFHTPFPAHSQHTQFPRIDHHTFHPLPAHPIPPATPTAPSPVPPHRPPSTLPNPGMGRVRKTRCRASSAPTGSEPEACVSWILFCPTPPATPSNAHPISSLHFCIASRLTPPLR